MDTVDDEIHSDDEEDSDEEYRQLRQGRQDLPFIRRGIQAG